MLPGVEGRGRELTAKRQEGLLGGKCSLCPDCDGGSVTTHCQSLSTCRLTDECYCVQITSLHLREKEKVTGNRAGSSVGQDGVAGTRFMLFAKQIKNGQIHEAGPWTSGHKEGRALREGSLAV